jgi:isoamylase
MNSDVAPGSSAPLGSAVQPGGVNFSVYSKSASSVEVLLFDREEDLRPARVIALDALKNRTYHYWHVLVPDLKPRVLAWLRGGRGPLPD